MLDTLIRDVYQPILGYNGAASHPCANRRDRVAGTEAVPVTVGDLVSALSAMLALPANSALSSVPHTVTPQG